jgi:hypothetical protein
MTKHGGFSSSQNHITVSAPLHIFVEASGALGGNKVISIILQVRDGSWGRDLESQSAATSIPILQRALSQTNSLYV